MELTPSQLKAIAALEGIQEFVAAGEARSAFEAGKTYNPGRRHLPNIVKCAINRANDGILLNLKRGK